MLILQQPTFEEEIDRQLQMEFDEYAMIDERKMVYDSDTFPTATSGLLVYIVFTQGIFKSL